MREILFKAKRLSDGRWVIGNLVLSDDVEEGYKALIIPCFDAGMYTRDYQIDLGIENWYAVDPSTICQYTGLTDKDGNKIWENDIVVFLDASQYDNGYAEYYCTGKVVWDEETLSFQVTERLSCESYEALCDCVVKGNIFDNPELLKGGE